MRFHGFQNYKIRGYLVSLVLPMFRHSYFYVSMRLVFLIFFSLISQVILAQKPIHRMILIGDAGEKGVVDVSYRPTLDSILQTTIPQTIVFLGDNIYPKGMPPVDHDSRAEAEEILRNQLQLVENSHGVVYLIPGNHDWKQGRKEGWEYLQLQQRWIDSLHHPRIQFYPKGGCPGPVEIAVTDSITLVILDTQWFLHPWLKPEGEDSPCESVSIEDVLSQLDDVLFRNQSKQVIVAGHHPVFTYGEHGGVFTWKDHLFPLTAAHKKWYIPLPVVGSIYPMYRKIFGNIQDNTHPRYRLMARSLARLLESYPNTIYASGHDHNLQYAWKDSVHYVVSGAGVKSTHVKKKKFAKYVSPGVGFVVLNQFANGESQLDYYEGNKYTFSQRIAAPELKTKRVNTTSSNSNIIQHVASTRYQASPQKDRWWGKNYRAEWNTPVQVPVLDLQKEYGGLKILQRGGGMQTLSLRLSDSSGTEYTLRSIEKFPEKAIPPAFRKTFAQDIVQDQISAAHPYAALVIPSLAKAAGIYHTNPRLVYLPDDPELGIYQRDFANQLMLLEERPSGVAEDKPHFGYADKVIGTDKLIELLAKDNDHQVDQVFVLRSRLFDLWIGDWDRHDDQWRWAQKNNKSNKTFRPIPRDRDQAFFVNEGRLPKLWSRKWALPKFQGFDVDLNWVPGFMFNGRYFDRHFLNEVSEEEWVRQAEELVRALPDSVIEHAIRQWPSNIYNLSGDEIVNKLKQRRARLAQWALEHYHFLAKEVNVIGSDKREHFDVKHKENGNVLVTVRKIAKDGELGKKLYQREFIKGQTREIRLFGLSGNDVFQGAGNGWMKVRVIGGDGNDSVVTTKSNRFIIYDQPQGVQITGRAFRTSMSNDASVNEFNRREFQYDRLAPLIYANFNPDDGLFIGGGFLWQKHGFRKKPYQAQHLFIASFAPLTTSFNFNYSGRFTEAIGKWTLEIDGDVKSPNYVNNFFGYGNETVFDKTLKENPSLVEVDDNIDYYRLRFQEISGEVKLSKPLGAYGYIKTGMAGQIIEIENPGNKSRLIKEFDDTLPISIIEDRNSYLGGVIQWGFDKRDHPTLVTRGVFLEQRSRLVTGVGSSNSGWVGNHNLTVSFYQSFRLPARVTFAIRAGAGTNSGAYEIYQAQILDGKSELRGFRKTRFYGDSELYLNNEVRIKLGSIRSYLFPAAIGIHGFYDLGRVWYKNSDGIDPSARSGKSTRWHKGFGGGFWFTPFNLTVVSTEVARSEEGYMGYIRLGFLF
jgi:hypothetical protein